MASFLSTLPSRLMAFCALLCMVATLNVGLMQGQNIALNLQHLALGELELGHDHGLLACDVDHDHCDTHVAPVEADHEGGVPGHHHHHAGETPSAPLPQNGQLQRVSVTALLVLKPGLSTVPAGLTAPTPDQPPRV